MSEKQAERIRQTRQREVESINKGKAAVLPCVPFDAAVVGMTHVPTYPENLFEVERLSYEADAMGEPLACIIIRKPDNPADANCCETHVPALGDEGLVGWLPRPVAAKMARLLDAGEVWQGEVSHVRIQSEHLDRPGLTIRLSKVV